MCMVLIAPCEIFENMLQLKRFGLNFERILNKKNGYITIEVVLYQLPEEFFS